MQDYSNRIALTKNSRGVYDFDTTKGCTSGMKNDPGGCYGECYAYRSSLRYGYNFKKTVLRDFENIKHLESVRNQISNTEIPFIRIGVTGDPSENWKHTIRILKLIYGCGKPVVIITKHWNNLTISQLKELSKVCDCVNTSVSALDNVKLLKNRLLQYVNLKDYCKSILRIVSCDFNNGNLTSLYLNELQDMLFNNKNIIDTILRVSLNNIYLKKGIINVKKIKFLNKECLATIKNRKTFIGYCDKCPELCGLKLNFAD